MSAKPTKNADPELPPSIYNTIDSMSAHDIDQLPFGIIKLDEQGNVLSFNQYEARLSAMLPIDVVGKNFRTSSRRSRPAPTSKSSEDDSRTRWSAGDCM